MGARWLLKGEGPLTVGAGQVGGLVASQYASHGRADVLLNFMPLSVDKPGDPLHRCPEQTAGPDRLRTEPASASACEQFSLRKRR